MTGAVHIYVLSAFLVLFSLVLLMLLWQGCLESCLSLTAPCIVGQATMLRSYMPSLPWPAHLLTLQGTARIRWLVVFPSFCHPWVSFTPLGKGVKVAGAVSSACSPAHPPCHSPITSRYTNAESLVVLLAYNGISHFLALVHTVPSFWNALLLCVLGGSSSVQLSHLLDRYPCDHKWNLCSVHLNTFKWS